ncbi:bidirectional sugar transporter SWEET2a-like protein isoform X1 [Cinnamomum micranthum f. kanehirae]|uniref:Bidirectional sugar transporter SWEET2a-like protein isoform X1 n=1 Tax=Cinnamomum micranthum f. kanehirae TaxID=337451 RepID=A0A443NNA7_9MAGN|nr:bidirectional sugar transporter SWEET2a-like protein isoform X1 [Cinnamomum micranthum f. kanehirae]
MKKEAPRVIASRFLSASKYGLPMISSGIILVATINCTGATFQLIYIIIFIIYVKKAKKGEDGWIIGGGFLVYLHFIAFLSMRVPNEVGIFWES